MGLLEKLNGALAGPTQVLEYLGHYTHRVAISNERLISVEGGHVRFRWWDYAHGHRVKIMPLSAAEFLRRFLLPVLAGGFVRIRPLPECGRLGGVGGPAASEGSRRRRRLGPGWRRLRRAPVARGPRGPAAIPASAIPAERDRAVLPADGNHAG
jgi:hypothetical protein